MEYVEGQVLMPFQVADPDAAVHRLGRLLRDLHDASAEYVPPYDAVWNIVIPANRCDLVVHHDAAPWNLVRNPSRWVLIDWDTAAPVPGSGSWPTRRTASSRSRPALLRARRDGCCRRSRTVTGSTATNESNWQRCSRRAFGACTRCWNRAISTASSPGAKLWQAGHGAVWRADAEYAERNYRLFLAAVLDDA